MGRLGVGGVANHQRVAVFCAGSPNTLDTALGSKGRKRDQQEGKRQQELAVDMSHGPLGIGKRYAARVFHNWSKDARDLGGPRLVHLWFFR